MFDETKRDFFFLLKPSKFEIFHSVESYDKQTTENRRNFNYAEKLYSFHIYKISISNCNRTILRRESSLCQKFTSVTIMLSEIQAVKEEDNELTPLVEDNKQTNIY